MVSWSITLRVCCVSADLAPDACADRVYGELVGCPRMLLPAYLGELCARSPVWSYAYAVPSTDSGYAATRYGGTATQY
eukprot:3307120-Rhodomonas_salina.4